MQSPAQLQPGETIVLAFRKHWFLLFLNICKIFFFTTLPYLGYAYLLAINLVPPGLRAAHVFQFLGTFWLLVIWWLLSSAWTKYYLELWLVTNHRVISVEQPDYFDREVSAWNIERILEVQVRIGNFIETFMGYGTLEIHTAGVSDEHERVRGVPDPEKVREVIMAETSRINSLEEANKNQEELIHTISHEVKSYLTKDEASLAIIASGDVGNVPTEVQSFAKEALAETRKGVSAVIDILHGADPKKGTVALHAETFDLSQKIQELFSQFKPVAERKGLSMTLSLENGLCMVRGDEKKLMDLVYRNVVDNSIRYTKTGSVKITLSKSPNAAICTVTDTGVGISPEDMQRLFTEGGHGEHSTDINPDSTGFGLASAKKTIEAHAGSIHALSDGPGKGSSFVISMPLAR